MCGIVGVIGNSECNREIYNQMQRLQNRGQDTAGIYTYDGNNSHLARGAGTVKEAVPESRLEELTGYVGIGQTKYTTIGKLEHSMQPVVVDSRHGELAVVHNGSMVNYRNLRKEAERRGLDISPDASDTELFSYVLATADNDKSFPRKSLEGAIKQSMKIAGPTESMIIQHGDNLYAVRGSSGNRPLYYAERPDGGYGIASESRVLEIEGYKNAKQVKAGEMIKISRGRVPGKKRIAEALYKRCAIELAYFASAGEVRITNLLSREKQQEMLSGGFEYLENGALIGEKDPHLFARNIREGRKRSGKILAKNHGVEADYVAGILGSGLFAAIGYAHESGLDARLTALMRDPKYNKRNFILPDGKSKVKGYKLKFIADPNQIDDSSTVLVDDSIWELNTSSGVVELMRLHGARDLHLRVGTPPITDPCFYGIAVSEKKKLVAAQMEKKLGEEYIDGIEMLLRLRFFGLDYPKEELIDIAAHATRNQSDVDHIVEQSLRDENNFLIGEPKGDHRVRGIDDLSHERFSLDYLTVPEFIDAFDLTSGYCLACMTGEYWGFNTQEEWFVEAMKV